MALSSTPDRPQISTNPLRTSLFLILSTVLGCATNRTPSPTGEGHTLFAGIAAERVERSAHQWGHNALDFLAYLIRHRATLTENFHNDTYWQQVLARLNQYLHSVREYRSQHPECFTEQSPTNCTVPTFDMTIWSREDIQDFLSLLESAVSIEARRIGEQNERNLCESQLPPHERPRPPREAIEPSDVPFWILVHSLRRHMQDLHTFSYMRPNLLANQSPIPRS